MMPNINRLGVLKSFLEMLGVLMRFAVGILLQCLNQCATAVFPLTAGRQGWRRSVSVAHKVLV